MDVYVVTGTSRGLGRALADVAAASTSNLIIEIGRGVSSKNARSTALEADFSDMNQISSACDALATELARVAADQTVSRAVLLNNAGVVLPVARFDQLDADSLQRNMMVNVVAPMLLTQAFAKATHGIASRLVVNISSGAAKRPIRGWSAYCTAKAAIEMATRVAAEEAKESDPTLAVCSLAPGVIDTGMQATIRGTTLEAFPDRARFEEMKNNGVLRDADAVARDIIQLIANGQLVSGGNHDIRELPTTSNAQ